MWPLAPTVMHWSTTTISCANCRCRKQKNTLSQTQTCCMLPHNERKTHNKQQTLLSNNVHHEEGVLMDQRGSCSCTKHPNTWTMGPEHTRLPPSQPIAHCASRSSCCAACPKGFNYIHPAQQLLASTRSQAQCSATSSLACCSMPPHGAFASKHRR